MALVAAVAVAGCGDDDSGDRPATTTASDTDSTSTTADDLHPHGYLVKEGKRVELPSVSAGEASITIHVGDTFAVTGEHWSPDNPERRGELIESTVLLVEATDDGLIYQAAAPGTIRVQVGPVGHPAGCDESNDCADATPPPVVNVRIVE